MNVSAQHGIATHRLVDGSIREAPAALKNRPHLVFLDGIRGLAALHVFLTHFWSLFEHQYANGHSLLRSATWWMDSGRYSVSVFIVLSGYCLMLPVVNDETFSLRGGLSGFAWRRARRIMPPYYAALFLAVLIKAIGIRFHIGSGHFADRGSLISHLLLIHNISNRWIYAIDTPMWSVATEWDIYFLFALILLPLWRLGGALITIPVALILGLAPHFLIVGNNLDWAAPWFLGLFCFGMWGAQLSFGRRAHNEINLAEQLCVGLGLILLSLFAWRLYIDFPNAIYGGSDLWLKDYLFGAAIGCLLVYCAALSKRQAEGRIPSSLILSLFASPFATKLGSFSYSLYLVHHPLLIGAFALAGHFHLSPKTAFAIFISLVLPAIAFLAQRFYLVFERPFLSARSQSRT